MQTIIKCPVRARGLKLLLTPDTCGMGESVVPSAGTWIEIYRLLKNVRRKYAVVPRAGTWIEI